MINLSSVYHEDYRDTSTEELMTRLELYQFDRLELLDEPATDVTQPSVDYLEYRQNVILEELTRRKRLIARFPDDPRRPQWPDRNSERYQKQIDLAAELKRIWRIDRYCADVLLLKLIPSGPDRWRAHCPFHDDSTPSFTVYRRDDRAWCHGCNQGGDVFDLTGLTYGLPRFSDQLRKLGEFTMEAVVVEEATG